MRERVIKELEIKIINDGKNIALPIIGQYETVEIFATGPKVMKRICKALPDTWAPSEPGPSYQDVLKSRMLLYKK